MNENYLSPKLGELLEALTCLPGVGQRTAQKMMVHLLCRDILGAKKLASALKEALNSVSLCQKCRMLSEEALCAFCQDPKRDPSSICVVHQPLDVLGIERTASYRGLYFVLNGHLSPIDGVDGISLGVPLLLERVKNETIHELILATSSSAEGEMTAYYIRQCVKDEVQKITTLAQGAPIGAELEYLDLQTLTLAFNKRQDIMGGVS